MIQQSNDWPPIILDKNVNHALKCARSGAKATFGCLGVSAAWESVILNGFEKSLPTNSLLAFFVWVGFKY